jgi:glycine oxidase
MVPDPSDGLIVVGGGVIGLSVAWRAAQAGITVTVIDPDPGHGASWAAAGMLAPVAEAHFGEAALTRLLMVAAAHWPAFARELEQASGRPVGYRSEGALLVAVDGSDRAATDDELEYRLGLGLPARRLSASACRLSEPLLAPGIRGGVAFDGDHQVDNRLVVAALLEAVAAAGVTIVHDAVASIDLDSRQGNQSVGGVTTDAGRHVAAHAVVLAAGCHSRGISGLPEDERPPVRPVKGLTLRVRTDDPGLRLRRTIRGLVHGRSCYLVPRDDGSVVVGATVEEKGFDRSVSVGSVGDLLADARLLVPSLDEYTLVDATSGLRPGSPDNGILLAPVTADCVMGHLTGDDVGTGPFAEFGPGRFAAGRASDATSRPEPVGSA